MLIARLVAIIVQFVVIKPNTYQDSLRLIRLSNILSSTSGTSNISVMMGTPLNKDQLDKVGMLTDVIKDAAPNDLIITAEVADETVGQRLATTVEEFLSQAQVTPGGRVHTVRSLDGALRALPDANIALISVPGEYAAAEARSLLDRGMNVFLFSDNVTVDDEVALKTQARDAGLIVMGPDCGTALIAGAPLGFANSVRTGNVGIVAASGTGCQEVMVHINRLGGGVSHAIGVGGRDLSAAVGGIASTQALNALGSDPDTDVIVLVSKPPAPEIRNQILRAAVDVTKPVVMVLVGQRGGHDRHDGVWVADTLDEAALLAVELAGTPPGRPIDLAPDQHSIRGVFTGGTFATEAAFLLERELDLPDDPNHTDGYVLRAGGHEVIDLGDDHYTHGKPHPMIEPSVRNPYITAAVTDPSTAVVLVDVVIGYGSHPDPAGVLAEVVTAARANLDAARRQVAVVASICGTEADAQDLATQRAILQDAGIVVMPSNASAARYAANVATRKTTRAESGSPADPLARALLSREPAVINIGVREFVDALSERSIAAVHYEWQPVAGGDKHLQDLLAALR